MEFDNEGSTINQLASYSNNQWQLRQLYVYIYKYRDSFEV